jgi:2-dehydropantoate 2-reductase
VIIGAGAIGGVVGARLHHAGRDVLLIARAHARQRAVAGLARETVRDRHQPGWITAEHALARL